MQIKFSLKNSYLFLLTKLLRIAYSSSSLYFKVIYAFLNPIIQKALQKALRYLGEAE